MKQSLSETIISVLRFCILQSDNLKQFSEVLQNQPGLKIKSTGSKIKCVGLCDLVRKNLKRDTKGLQM